MLRDYVLVGVTELLEEFLQMLEVVLPEFFKVRRAQAGERETVHGSQWSLISVLICAFSLKGISCRLRGKEREGEHLPPR